MSAFLCTKNHFVYLLNAAINHKFQNYDGAFHYYHEGRSIDLRNYDTEAAAEIANMLYRANLKSVETRYPSKKSSASLPGAMLDAPIMESDFDIFSLKVAPDAVQVLKSIHCLEYQSNEAADWEQSEAYAFLRALESRAIDMLPGYGKANWGAPGE